MKQFLCDKCGMPMEAHTVIPVDKKDNRLICPQAVHKWGKLQNMEENIRLIIDFGPNFQSLIQSKVAWKNEYIHGLLDIFDKMVKSILRKKPDPHDKKMKRFTIDAVCDHCHKPLKAHVGLKPEIFNLNDLSGVNGETIKPIIVVEPHFCGAKENE